MSSENTSNAPHFRRLCLSALSALCLVSVACAQATNGKHVIQTAYTGLYDVSGNLVDSNVNVDDASFDLTYIGILTFGFHSVGVSYSAISGGTMPTNVRIKYSSTAWQTEPNSAVVGIQVGNYLESSDNTAMTRSLSLYTSFQAPTGTILTNTTATWGGSPTYSADLTYANVNPKLFVVNQGTVDSSDATGKTAIYSYNPTSATPAPWTVFPATSFSYTTPRYYEVYFPVIWVFAKPTANGQFYTNGIGYPAIAP